MGETGEETQQHRRSYWRNFISRTSVKIFLLVLKWNFQAVIPALYSSKGSSYCNDVLGATWLLSTLPLLSSVELRHAGAFDEAASCLVEVPGQRNDRGKMALVCFLPNHPPSATDFLGCPLPSPPTRPSAFLFSLLDSSLLCGFITLSYFLSVSHTGIHSP